MSEPGAVTNTDVSDESAAQTEESAGAEARAKPPPAVEPRPAGRPWWVRRYTFTGTAGGLLFIWFSMTPSLLPRTALFQGLVSGVSGSIGYGLGVFAVWLVRYMRTRNYSPPPPPWAWKVLIPVGVIGMVIMAIRFHVWQDQVRDLMGVAHLEWYDYPEAAILSLVVLFTLVEIGQLIRRLVRFLVDQLDRVGPFRLSVTIVVIVLVTLTITLLNGVVIKFTMNKLNSTFNAVNEEGKAETQAPKSPLRPGGPESLVQGATLGHQGRIFVQAGPTVEK